MSLLHYWETQRPVKRRKTADTNPELDSNVSDTRPPSPSASSETGEASGFTESGLPPRSSQTELETSLPAIQADEQAIQEYEESQAAKEDDTEPGLHVRLRDGVWKKGKSSIYVDAFNLALDTVLDEESHLFSEAETEVFTQWKDLSYQSQYLYEFPIPRFLLLRTLIMLDMFDFFYAKPLLGIVSID